MEANILNPVTRQNYIRVKQKEKKIERWWLQRKRSETWTGRWYQSTVRRKGARSIWIILLISMGVRRDPYRRSMNPFFSLSTDHHTIYVNLFFSIPILAGRTIRSPPTFCSGTLSSSPLSFRLRPDTALSERNKHK